eukprot:937140_1
MDFVNPFQEGHLSTPSTIVPSSAFNTTPGQLPCHTLNSDIPSRDAFKARFKQSEFALKSELNSSTPFEPTNTAIPFDEATRTDTQISTLSEANSSTPFEQTNTAIPFKPTPQGRRCSHCSCDNEAYRTKCKLCEAVLCPTLSRKRKAVNDESSQFTSQNAPKRKRRKVMETRTQINRYPDSINTNSLTPSPHPLPMPNNSQNSNNTHTQMNRDPNRINTNSFTPSHHTQLTNSQNSINTNSLTPSPHPLSMPNSRNSINTHTQVTRYPYSINTNIFTRSPHPLSLPNSQNSINTHTQVTRYPYSINTNSFTLSPHPLTIPNNHTHSTRSHPLTMPISSHHTAIPYHDCVTVLQKRFGFTSLKPEQYNIIAKALNGHHCLAVMPTGYGKTLCYQLPVLIHNHYNNVSKTTVVISPLVSLIHDQVQAAQLAGINAIGFTGTNASFKNDETAGYELIYVTPEKVVAHKEVRQFLKVLYARNMLFQIAVDEAHCVSTWCHFRKAYKNLSIHADYPS